MWRKNICGNKELKGRDRDPTYRGCVEALAAFYVCVVYIIIITLWPH